MKKEILKVLTFRLTGKFAQFRKFYTNASSLSYFIPPRTVIIGMFASILEIPRDEYYEMFSPEYCAISVKIETPLKKTMNSMNYLKGIGDITNHSQCKLEVVQHKELGLISYKIYLASLSETFSKALVELHKKIGNRQFGYGVYFGQRQFRADIEVLDIINSDQIQYMENSQQVDTLCRNDNIVSIDEKALIESGSILISDQMPIHLEKIEGQGIRKSVDVGRIVYEQNGQSIRGEFDDCYRIGEEIVGFYES